MFATHNARLFSLLFDTGAGAGAAGGGGAAGAGSGAAAPAGSRATNAAGVVQITRGAAPAGGGSGGGGGNDFSIDTCFENGSFLGGRYDTDGHPITRELFDEHPGLVGVAKTLQESRRKITELTQGKVQLAAPLTADMVNGLDFTITDGKLPKDTIKALEGRPMDANFIGEVLVPILERATSADRQRNEEWLQGWNTAERFNGQLDDAISWAGSTLSDDDMRDMNAALASPRMRDAAMEQLLRDFRAAHNQNTAPPAGEKKPANPARQDNTVGFGSPGSGAGSVHSGLFQGTKEAVDAAYQGALMKAKDHGERKAIDAKLERTYKARGW